MTNARAARTPRHMDRPYAPAHTRAVSANSASTASGARTAYAEGELAWHDERRPRAGGRTPPLLPTLLGVYGAVGALAATVAVAIDRDPIATASWVGLTGEASALWSVGGGVVLGAATIASTRIMVRRASWARALHSALRPAVRDVGAVPLALMALASGVAEELFFRGLLAQLLGTQLLGTQLLGLLLSSAVFGLLHQVRGPARWAWVAWAFVMGLLFGGLFLLTGSLAGPIVAHVLINAANLRFLRDTDAAAPFAQLSSPLTSDHDRP
jgi:membrane protease YdiL (CAAX protease family)